MLEEICLTVDVQVANFDMVEQDEEPPADQQPTAADVQQRQQQQQVDADADDALSYDPAATELHKSQQQFWAAILGERPAEQQGQLGLATQQLGQRRARQAARYIFYDSESETDSRSSSNAGGSEGAQQQQQQQQDEDDVDGVKGGKRRRRGRRRTAGDDDELYQADEQVGGHVHCTLLLQLAFGIMALLPNSAESETACMVC